MNDIKYNNNKYNYNYSNGITGNVYWNGESSGGTAAIGMYICKLTCENECDPFTFAQNFVNVGAISPYAPNKPQYKLEDKIINPCCLIDYTLQNKTFNIGRTYQVKENIYVNSNVKALSNSNLKLIAGKNIEILNEFEANSNSEFSANIVPCADAHRLANNSVLSDNDFIYYEQDNNISNYKKQKANNILNRSMFESTSIFPNPSNIQSTLLINAVSKSKISSSLFDINGKIITELISEQEIVNSNYSIDLNLKGLIDGVYIVKTHINSKLYVNKLIVNHDN